MISEIRPQVRRSSGPEPAASPAFDPDQREHLVHAAQEGAVVARPVGVGAPRRSPAGRRARRRRPRRATRPLDGRRLLARGGRFGHRPQEVEDEEHRARHELDGGQRAPLGVGIARQLRVGAERAEPMAPLVAVEVLEPEARGRDHRVLPGLEARVRVGGRAVELAVALAQEPERVVVRAEPEVQAVLLDPPGGTAAAGSLAPEPPAPLVHRDRLEPVAPSGLAQPPGRRHRGHTAAEHGDALPSRRAGRHAPGVTATRASSSSGYRASGGK